MKFKLLPILLAFFSSIVLNAKIVLPKVFSDNMVLQRNRDIPVWGKALPGEGIELRLNQQTVITTADQKGNWRIIFRPEIAGGPYELSVFASDTLVFKNVLVGEVWVCSGQSNMEWKVCQSKDAAKEIALADNPFIRHLKVALDINSMPQSDFTAGSWQICDTSTVGEFTAAGYYFAKNLYNELKVPVGLINATWGGTNIETWLSRDAMEKNEEFKSVVAAIPQIDMDSLNALLINSTVKRILQIKGLSITPAATHFSKFDLDDEDWPEMKVPGFWEQQQLGDFDGVLWFRKEIVLSDSLSRQKASLELSKIDDEDITFVNGVKIGSSLDWDISRKYLIPDGVLKPGKNIIAVRVKDNRSRGGFHGNADDLKLNLASGSIPLSGNWKYQVEVVKRSAVENLLPSLCYNAMINPLIPYGIRGVLWYQGETNAKRAFQYRKAFPLLISDWRSKWQQGDFPFYYVQLSTYNNKGNSNEGCAWAELREAQALSLAVPNTGMCVSTDVGNPTDIHPVDKQTIGNRLAAMALNNTYNKPRICGGPTYKSMRIVGEELELSFDNIGSGLMTTDKYGYIKGFEIAGEDQVFYFAKAYIKGDKILIYNENVKNPEAVHYGWMGDASECNVFNKEGFPLGPFRSNEWKTITKDNKYVISVLNE
ncbi:MAG: sialate O-acetylesterase [Saprospiraceae bacterium]